MAGHVVPVKRRASGECALFAIIKGTGLPSVRKGFRASFGFKFKDLSQNHKVHFAKLWHLLESKATHAPL
jgi:hypothetical protein